MGSPTPSSNLRVFFPCCLLHEQSANICSVCWTVYAPAVNACPPAWNRFLCGGSWVWAWFSPAGPPLSSLPGLPSLVPWENASPHCCLLHFFVQIILLLLFTHVSFFQPPRCVVSFLTSGLPHPSHPPKDCVCLIHLIAQFSSHNYLPKGLNLAQRCEYLF